MLFKVTALAEDESVLPPPEFTPPPEVAPPLDPSEPRELEPPVNRLDPKGPLPPPRPLEAEEFGVPRQPPPREALQAAQQVREQVEARILDVIEDAGLTSTQYNALAAAVAVDTRLQQRVDAKCELLEAQSQR